MNLPTTTSRGILNPIPQSEPTKLKSQSLLGNLGHITKSSKKLSKRTQRVVMELKKQANNYKGSLESQNKKIIKLNKRINQQNTRLAEQEEKLTEMNRRLLESEQMMADFKPGISREQRVKERN